jgi:hypothetical protein
VKWTECRRFSSAANSELMLLLVAAPDVMPKGVRHRRSMMFAFFGNLSANISSEIGWLNLKE